MQRFPLYSVHCTVYSVQGTVYNFFNDFYDFGISLVWVERQKNRFHNHHRPSMVPTVLCTVYSVQCRVYSVQGTVYTFFGFFFLSLVGVERQYKSLISTTGQSLLNHAARICILKCLGFREGKYTVPPHPCIGHVYQIS